MMPLKCLKFGDKVTHGSAGNKKDKWSAKRMGMRAMTQMKLDIFASQDRMNYFECELTELAYHNVSQHYMNFSDYHIYDYIKTRKDCQLYDAIEPNSD